MEREPNKTVIEHKPVQGRSKTPAILAGVAFAALAATTGYLLWQVNELKTEISSLNNDFTEQVVSAQEQSASNMNKNRLQLDELRQQLALAVEKAQGSVGQAKIEAKNHAERLAKQLAAKQDEVSEQISTMQTETAAQFEQVSTDVGAVRSEVASTREDLDGMVTGLRQVNGDLGVMSGRIATNGDELAALKALGERNYFEFEVPKNADKPVRVEHVGIDLRGTDEGKNRFTIDVFADDKRINKKNRTVNEPIQFYVGGRGGLPYEIVVNEVSDGMIKGYLATPKVDLLAKR